MKKIVIYEIHAGDDIIRFIKETDAQSYLLQPSMIESRAKIIPVSIVVFESVEDYTNFKYAEIVKKLKPNLSTEEQEILGIK